MTDQSERNSRATLCMKLAQREPANRTFWMAEAENWSRLSQENPMAMTCVKIDFGILARLRAQSAKFPRKFYFLGSSKAVSEHRAC